jgi:lysophospholipase L1-like esterase
MRRFLFSLPLTGPCLAEVKHFHFGTEPVPAGQIQIASKVAYNAEKGYGFDAGSDATILVNACTGNVFRFSVKVKPGVYLVDLNFGYNAVTTVKSEQRRLSLEKAVGHKQIAVHVRTSEISASKQEVRLNDREKTSEMLAWDDRLTLEFSGGSPVIQEIYLQPAPTLPILFILGDSTVCDQPNEPFASWGQMLPRWFDPGIAVANYAQSGESLRSSLNANRLAKVVSQCRTGDFVLIQFGHNDEKDKSPGAGAFTTYADLLRQYAREIQAKGAQPILITPVQRRRFDATGKLTDTHGDFPAAMKQVAQEMKLPLLDLQAMSTSLYEALGSEGSGALFKEGDGTHHNNYGAYELSRCVVMGIQKCQLPELSKHLLPNLPDFDPKHPDDPKTLAIPASPGATGEKPLGN